MAERTGLSVHTLRFYEREGILASPIRRGPGGRRRATVTSQPSDRDIRQGPVR